MRKPNEKYFDNNNNVDIENYLSPCEELISKHKPNRKAYIMTQTIKILPFAIVWLLFDTLGVYFILSSGMLKEESFLIAFLIIIVAVHLIPIYIWTYHTVQAFKKVKHEEYAITNERVIIKEGHKAVNLQLIDYNKILSVYSDRTYTDKLLGVGDVHIVTEYKTAILHDLPNYEELTSLIHSNAVATYEEELYEEIPEE